MAAIGSISSVNAALLAQIQGTAQQQQPPKPAQAAPQDTVHISKAALAALGSGDSDHDGDSH